MSKSQMKKAVSELRSYLNNDTHGTDLLDKVSREVVNVRSESSEVLDRAEKAEQIRDTLKTKLDDMRRELKQADMKVKNLQAAIASAKSREEVIAKEVDRLAAKREGFYEEDCTMDGLTSMVKNVAKKMGGPAPAAIRSSRKRRRSILTWRVSDVLVSPDKEGFATLGQFMFLASVFTEGYVGLTCEVKPWDWRRDYAAPVWQQKVKAWFRFFRHSVDCRSTEELYNAKFNQNEDSGISESGPTDVLFGNCGTAGPRRRYDFDGV